MHDTSNVGVVEVQPVGEHRVQQAGITKGQALVEAHDTATRAFRQGRREGLGRLGERHGKRFATGRKRASYCVKNQMFGALAHVRRHLLKAKFVREDRQGL
jgi:hypothetical protein